MPDITLCSPTRFRKKCYTCYRRTAKPDRWQPYSNFYSECDKYYLPNKKEITIAEYNKIMSQIIGRNMDIDKTLIALLEESGKYTIKRSSRKGKLCGR